MEHGALHRRPDCAAAASVAARRRSNPLAVLGIFPEYEGLQLLETETHTCRASNCDVSLEDCRGS